jgi:hypothetical protein
MVGYAPVVLHKCAKQVVAQVKIQGRAFRNIRRKTQQEIGNAVTAGGAAITGELTGETESAGYALVARVNVVHDVMEKFEPGVNYMLSMRPGKSVFCLDGGVVEDLHAIRAANLGVRTSKHDLRENGGLNPGDSKRLWQVDTGRIRASFTSEGEKV